MEFRPFQLAAVAVLLGLAAPPASSADDNVPDPASAAVYQYVEMVPSSTGDQPVSSSPPIAAALLHPQKAEQESPTTPSSSGTPKKPVRPKQDPQANARSDEQRQASSSLPNPPSLANVGVNAEMVAFFALMAATVALLIVSALRRRPN